MPEVEPICKAPFVAMSFDPTGRVTACAANQRFVLGHVGREPLAEMWSGPTVRRLRDALAAGDLTQGCDRCRLQVESGNVGGALLQSFAWLDADPEPAWPQRIELAMSNTCNLQCVMCAGELSSSIRAQREHLPALPARYGDAFFEELRPFLRHARQIRFLGGEPFLAEESFRVWDLMIEEGATAESNVTTNGTRYTPKVEHVLEHLPFSFGVSIDGTTKETVESIRVGARFEVIMENLDRFAEHARRWGTSLDLTYCLMVQNWHEFGDFLRLGDRMGSRVYVNPVHAPPQHSLYRLPPAAFLEVLASLERDDERMRAALDRNLDVWTGTLADLRHHRSRIDEVDREARIADWMPLLDDLVAAGPDRRALERAAARHLDGTDAGWIRCDDQDRIVEADGFAGVPDEALLHEPSSVLRDLLPAHLGARMGILAEAQGGGVTAKVVRFEAATTTTTVLLVLFASGGSACRLSMWADRSSAPVAVAAPRRST